MPGVGGRSYGPPMAITIDTEPAATIDTARTLGQEADRRWAELDAASELPTDLVHAALDAGLFRTLVPTELGGAATTPVDWFRIGVELARHEASLAWVVTQGAAELGWIGAGADERWATEVLADPRASSASSIAGLGELDADGATVSFGGRWRFNTGCTGATWIGGLSLVAGRAETRIAWVPADRAEIVRDWDATGMRGTGSHSTVVARQEIDLAWTFDVFSPTTNDRGPYRCLVGNGNWPIAGSVAAVQLGAARRALDEGHQLLLDKAPAPELTPLARNAAVQRAFARAEAVWNASVASVERELDAMWNEAHRDGTLSPERRYALFTANALASEQAAAVVESVSRLVGTVTLDRRHPLSRCRRDVDVLSTHLAVNGQALEYAGQIRLGLLDRHIRV